MQYSGHPVRLPTAGGDMRRELFVNLISLVSLRRVMANALEVIRPARAIDS